MLQPHLGGVPNYVLEDDLFTNISGKLDNDDLRSSTLHNLSNGYGASLSGGDDLFGKFPFHFLFSPPFPFNKCRFHPPTEVCLHFFYKRLHRAFTCKAQIESHKTP